MRDGLRVLAAAVVLGGCAAVFVFHPLTPALPRAGIDPSWVTAMGEAADRPTRFGVDTAFTYGPASPVVTGYLNAAWLSRTLPLQLGFAALFGWCAASLVAGRRPGRTAGDAVRGTAACALMLAAARNDADALFLALPFAVFLLALRRDPGRAEAAAALLGAGALGLTAVVKTSFPLAALPPLLVADAVGLARRRFPRFVPLFALGIAAGALLYGQRLSDLPAYAVLQGEVVAGYASAMAIDGPAWDLWSFALAALALAAAAVLARPRPDDPLDRWAEALGLAVALLFLFKAGFVRHDSHSIIGWTGAALVATLLAHGRLHPSGRHRAAVGVTAAACFVVLVYGPGLTVRQSTRVDRGGALLRLYAEVAAMPAREAAAAWDASRDASRFQARLAAEKTEAWAGIARDAPLGGLPGTVDVIPSRQADVLAAGLDYRGRPSFQEYSTYTAALAAVNRDRLEGPDAPRWILFGPESPEGFMSIDDRFPSLAEGPLWPDLLGLYRPDHRAGDLVALERRAAPVPVAFGPARDVDARFGLRVPVEGGPTWATVDVRPNLAGRVLSAVFRPPILTLAVWLDDGSERRFRLVPALAAAGFLLSPLVENASDYEILAARGAAGAERRVAGFAVEASAAGRWFYASGIAVTLQRLDVPASGDAPPAGRLSGPVAAPASGVFALPLRGRRRLALGYALDPAAPRRVCFSVLPADGSRRTLWSACLDPGAAPGSAALDVPDGVEELALETRCGGGSCPATWTLADGAEAARD